MANHVNTHVNFEKISDEGKSFLINLYKTRVRTGEGSQSWFPDLFVDGEELTYEMSEQYDYTVSNIGSKWSYIEEFDEDFCSMNIVSAWSCPDDGLIKLVEMVAQVDPDVVAYVSYEDECPNFVGAQVMTRFGIEENQEWDNEELREIAMEQIEGLAEHWDPEEEEFSDDGQDMLWEHQWEIINELQEQFLQTEGQFYLDGEHNAE